MHKNDKPYRQEVSTSGVIKRTFDTNIDPSELVWHRDKRDRVVTPTNENDWMIQFDNELPKKLIIGESVIIPKETYHRVIKGDSNLVVEIQEFDSLDELVVCESIEEELTAYHGGPHKFDKFELSKIGTGEGAQVFGWGLYFTDLESIARHYADVLGAPKILYKGKDINTISDFKDIFYYLDPDNSEFTSFSNVQQVKKILDTVQQMAESFLNSNYDKNDVYEQTYAEESKKVLNSIKKIKNNISELTVRKGKNLYKVSLHKGKEPSQYTWLEWDKGVDRKLINLIKNKLTEEQYKEGFFTIIKSLGISQERYIKDGESLYNALVIALGSDKAASLFLLENGIDGIKYPAESIARGATSNTASGFNYVVFDENAISIEKYTQLESIKEGKKKKGKGNKDACYHKVKSRYDVWPSAYACVPENTSKALTRYGWRDVNQLNIGDEIMTYNIEKDELEFKPILNLHRYKDVKTNVVRSGNNGFIFEATDNHKWVVKLPIIKGTKSQKYERITDKALIETSDLLVNKSNKHLVVSAQYNGGDNINFDKIFKYGTNWVKYILDITSEQRQAWLFSAIVYDGNQQKIERLTENTNNIDELNWLYTGPHGKQSFGFKQKDIEHRDAFLLSAFLNSGLVTWKKVSDKDIYSCHYTSNKRFKNTSNFKLVKENIADVWCPETENGTWVMMQETDGNGIITITGNSGALVQCRKVGAKNWGNKSEGTDITEDADAVNEISDFMHYIVSSYKNERIVMSHEDKIIFKPTPIDKQRVGPKPRGFWYGFGSSWLDWVRSEMPDWETDYVHLVKVNDSRILKISTFDELLAFTEEFGVKGDYAFGGSHPKSNINWAEVAKRYSGIEINPYISKGRMKFMWYYPWDVASGCVWGEDGIVSIELLDEDEIERDFDEASGKSAKVEEKTDYSKEKKKGLHGWFERRGGEGSQGWVDCNTCKKDPETGRKKCKPCGRKEGEKRSKYPACRPTPSACKTKDKGEKWGKKSENTVSLIRNLIHDYANPKN